MPLPAEAARITAAGEEALGARRKPAVDLDKFDDGDYVELASGETFGLQKVENDPNGRNFHLKNELHFHALNEADFKKLFERK